MVTSRSPTALMTYSWRVISGWIQVAFAILALLIFLNSFVVQVCAAGLLFGAAFVWEVNSGLRILLLHLDLFAFECSVRLFFVYDFSSDMLAKIIKQFPVGLI